MPKAAERAVLVRQGRILGQERDRQIDTARIPPSTFVAALFQLLHDFIVHDTRYKHAAGAEQLTIEERRKNLGMIGLTIKLLPRTRKRQPNRDEPVRSAYAMPQPPGDPSPNGFTGANPFELLRFLNNCDLGINTTSTPTENLTDAEAFAILDELASPAFLNMLRFEAKSRIALGGRMQFWQEAKTRAIPAFKDVRVFPEIYKLLQSKQDLYRLRIIIDALQAIANIALTPANAAQYRAQKTAILHHMVHIGESLTQKQMSPFTLNLSAPALLTRIFGNPALPQNDNNPITLRKLLTKLADRIAHAEWDIPTGKINHIIDTLNFSPIQAELNSLLPTFQTLQTDLQNLIAGPALELAAHYSAAPPAVEVIGTPLPGHRDLPQLYQLFCDLPKAPKIAHHPDAYSTENLYLLLEEETAEVQNLLGLMGLANNDISYDCTSENACPLSLQYMQLIYRIAHANNHPQYQQMLACLPVIVQHYLLSQGPWLCIPSRFLPGTIFHADETFTMPQLFPAYVAAELDNFVAGVIDWGKRCKALCALETNPIFRYALEYRYTRVNTYLQELVKPRHVNIADYLTAELNLQYVGFRNHLRHGDSFMETSIVPQREFLARYAGLILELPDQLRPLGAFRQVGLDLFG